MAAQIYYVEDALLARLRPALTREGQAHPVVELRSWPGKPEEYKLIHRVGAVLLMYRAGKFPELAHVVRPALIEWPAEFELGFMARNLRTHQADDASPDAGTGAYDLLEACRVALQGHDLPETAGAISVRSETYTGHREGVWGYSMRLTVPLISVFDVPAVPGPFTAGDPSPLVDLQLQHPAGYST
jgi:Gp37 protein